MNGSLRSGFVRMTIGVFCGVLLAALVSAFAAAQPRVYEAHMALYARPSASAPKGDSSYLSAANAALPGIAELLKSRSFLEPVVKSVPEGPSASQLADDTRMELVPLSTVIRVSVQAHSPELSQRLVEALAVRLERTDIFGGLAQLERLQKEASPASMVAPDLREGVGLALLAGVLAAVVVVQLLALLFPTLATPLQVQRAVGERLPVLDLGRPGADGLLRDFAGAEGSIVVIPVGQGGEDVAADVRRLVTERPAVEHSSDRTLFAFDRRRVQVSDLKNALAMVEDTSRVALVTR